MSFWKGKFDFPVGWKLEIFVTVERIFVVVFSALWYLPLAVGMYWFSLFSDFYKFWCGWSYAQGWILRSKQWLFLRPQKWLILFYWTSENCGETTLQFCAKFEMVFIWEVIIFKITLTRQYFIIGHFVLMIRSLICWQIRCL